MKNPTQQIVNVLGRSNSTLVSSLTARILASNALMWLMLITVSVSTSILKAQDELRPPKTTEEPSSPKYLILFVAVLLVAGVVFVASLKSKRTHQD